jgi:hypothetical protein
VNNVAAVGGAVNRCQSSLNDSGNVPGGPEIVVALTAEIVGARTAVTVTSGSGG